VRVSSTQQPATVSRIKVGEILPSFSYKFIDNTTTNDVYALKGNGKYKLIEFWGTWCRGCVQLIPELRSLHAEFGDKLDILSLNFNDSDLEKVAKFINAREMTWHHGLSTLELNRKLGVSMFPYSILVDENFKIIALNSYPTLVREYISKASASTK
jgi:thiol-disulfide isomerase/thioredoxin